MWQLKSGFIGLIGWICLIGFIGPSEIRFARLNPTEWVCRAEFNWAGLSLQEFHGINLIGYQIKKSRKAGDRY